MTWSNTLTWAWNEWSRLDSWHGQQFIVACSWENSLLSERSAHPSTAMTLIMVTLLLWPSCNYGHFILAETNAQSVIFIIKEPL